MEAYFEAYVKRQLMSQLHLIFVFKLISLFLKTIAVLQQCDTFRKKYSGSPKAYFYSQF